MPPACASSEVVRLTIPAIDSSRMVLRVEKGKGNKDRYVVLSPKLLEILRNRWRIEKPKHRLFESDLPGRHITRDAVNLACEKARSLSAFLNRSRPILCAMLSLYICWSLAPTYVPSNCCWAIAVWRPQPDTCGLRRTKFAPLPVHSTCCPVLLQPLSPSR